MVNKDRVSNAKEKLRDAWAWIIKSPITTLVASASFLAIVVGLVLFFRIVLLLLLVIAVIVLFILFEYGDDLIEIFKVRKVAQTLKCKDVCWDVTKFMFSVVSSSSKALSAYIHAPSTANDIYNATDFQGVYNQAPTLKLRLLRKKGEEPDCVYVKEVLQSSANARILDGHLAGYDRAVPTAHDVPLIKIFSVEFSETYVHLGILLTNTAASFKAARISDNATPPPVVDDSDPLF